MHLIIDGYSNSQKIMKDEKFIYDLLNSYPAKIGMTKIAGPHVFKYVGAKPEDWGISGIVFIAESHISFHTFVERSYINIDIFSCSDFNAQQVIEDLIYQFQLTKFISNLVNRDWKPEELQNTNQISPIHSI